MNARDEQSGNGAPLIELRGVRKVYGTGTAAMEALRGVDLRIERGEFVAVMGASGSGKSTCMNILGLPGYTDFRRVLVSGRGGWEADTQPAGAVAAALPGFCISELQPAQANLGGGERGTAVDLPARGRAAAFAGADVAKAGGAGRLGEPYAGRAFGRAAAAGGDRAGDCQPAWMLLADEPTGNLDSARSVEIMQLLRSLNSEEGITVIMVTHEPDMAAYAKRIVHFRDGLIEKDERQHEEKICSR